MGTDVIYTHDELVDQIKARNQKAFAYLYANYSRALYGVITTIVKNETESEDVLQNVFLKIWNSFDLYDRSKGRLYTWMLNIARNMAIDSTRSRYEKMKRHIRNIDSDVDTKLVAPETLYSDGIGMQRLVAHLKEDQRELIHLSYYYGYTHEELSKRMDMPLGTIKTKIRQALLVLREIGENEVKRVAGSK